MEKKKSINTAESILIVGSFFMFLYVGHNLVFINELSHFFERDSLWFLLPLITLVIAVHSYLKR
ncbi:hypothetical protein AV656_10915 [Bhargavaea cecembensis]|uniref:Uncharacterized protein n=1 Tax=Bhargavaea cecembensis TaxID=394098 RepID=A0A161RGJ4_9BACL|nr:hypothetical protein AV656_10915 [Bhargavaea cecembensis]